ncbi:MAG: hypothetical protein ACW98Y_06185 [Candidatus Thorarchaeota archaeon]|jgi:hypothetical protein
MQFELLLAALGTIILVVIVVFLLVYGLFLGIALGFVNGENRNIGTTFVTALGIALLGWIPILGCIISWYLIKTRHEVGWGGAIVAWLLTAIIAFIVIFAVLMVGGISLLALFGL